MVLYNNQRKYSCLLIFCFSLVVGLLRLIHRHLKGLDVAVDEEEKLFFDDDIWKAIGIEQIQSKPHYPSWFGDVFNIDKSWSSMKAANWHSWAIQHALVYLRTGLKTMEEYEMMKKVIFAIELSSRRVLTWEDVDLIDQLFGEFVEYFKLEVYRTLYARMKTLKPTLHQVCKYIHILGTDGQERT